MQKVLAVFVHLFAIATLVSQTAMDVFASLFAVGSLFLLQSNVEYRKLVFRRFGWEKFFLFMFGLFALSLVLGQSLVSVPAWSKLADFRWVPLAWLMGNFLVLNPPERKHWIGLAWIFSFASVYAILIFLLKYDPLDPSRQMDQFADGTVRTGGFLQQPIVFAQLYGIWLSFFLGFFTLQIPTFDEFKDNKDLYLAFLAALCTGSCALLLSFTRGIWIALPLSFLIVLAIRRWTWAVLFATLGALATLGLGFLWPAFESRLLHALQGGEGERLWIWQANLRMFMDHPWMGTGYSHNVELLPEYYKIVGAPGGLLQSHAHNQFLHILVGAGILGFLSYLAFWIFLILKSYRFAKKSKSIFYSSIGTGILTAILTFQFGGLFESNYEHSKIRYTLVLVVALLIWLDRQGSSSSQVSQLPDKQ